MRDRYSSEGGWLGDVVQKMSRIRHLGNQLRCRRNSDNATLEEKYERRSPHSQNAVDLFSSWIGSFPDQFKVSAGTMALHADTRILWALDKYGPLDGKKVLELGPLEGSHSYVCEQRGAEEVLAIEASKNAYLRCLVSKEILNLKRCNFLLGDFEKYLEETDQTFDIILASGVLYHMQNPVRVLDLITQKCDTLILWTHYYDEAAFPQNDRRRIPFANEPAKLDYAGHIYTLHQRTYLEAWHADAYCGGPDDTHFWMERPDIELLCRQNGFDEVEVAFEDSEGMNGPSCLYLMQRS